MDLLFDFFFRRLINSDRPWIQKFVQLPLAILLVGLGLYFYGTSITKLEWVEVTGILICIPAYPWLLLGLLYWMFNALQSAHERDPGSVFGVAAKQMVGILTVLSICFAVYTLRPNPSKIESVIGASLILFAVPSTLIVTCGMLSSFINGAHGTNSNSSSESERSSESKYRSSSPEDWRHEGN